MRYGKGDSMATQPIEEAAKLASGVTNDKEVYDGIQSMKGNSEAWGGLDKANQKAAADKNASIAARLNERGDYGFTRGRDGVWRDKNGVDMYSYTYDGSQSSGGGNGGNTGGSVGNPSGNANANANGGEKLTPTGYGNAKPYVIRDRTAQNILNTVKSNSQAWYSAPPEERIRLNAENKANMDALSQILGRGITYDAASGTYYFTDDGSKVYDSVFGVEEADYPKWQDRSSEIKNVYDTALSNQLTANEESRALQEYLLRESLAKAEKEYDAKARQSSIDTRKQLENEKLRQALNGQRGGVGERQFGIYQSAGSERLYNIELERQKLRADTESQIAQLKAEGKIAEAQLIAEFALQKDEALRQEAERVYNSDIRAAEHTEDRDDVAFDKYMTITNYADQKSENAWNRTLQIDDRDYNRKVDEDEREYQRWQDAQKLALEYKKYASDEKHQLFAEAISMAPYDGGTMLSELTGVSVTDPSVREYFSMALNAELQAASATKNYSKVEALIDDYYNYYVKGGRPIINDRGTFDGFVELPDGSIFNFNTYGSSGSGSGNNASGTDFNEGGTGTNGGGSNGNDTAGNNANGNTGNAANTSNNNKNNDSASDNGIDIEEDTKTDKPFVVTNADGKPETSNLDILTGINTLKDKEKNVNFNDPKAVDEYVKSNEALINSLNVTYKLGIIFDPVQKAYVYADGSKVTDTVGKRSTNPNTNSNGDRVPPPNRYSKESKEGNSIEDKTRPAIGVNGGKEYKLGTEAGADGTATNVPETATQVRNEVGNLVTTWDIDYSYLKSHPGTFAVKNDNGTYSYIQLEKPNFTITESSFKGGAFGYTKIGLDGKNLGTPSQKDLQIWFTWDASVANPDKYNKPGSYERERALAAMYPDYYNRSTTTEDGGSGSGGNGDYSYTPKNDTSKNTPSSSNGSFNADRVARSTMTFDEWLSSPQGKGFKNSSEKTQNNMYRIYLDNVAVNNGISEKEAKQFYNIINERNGG